MNDLNPPAIVAPAPIKINLRAEIDAIFRAEADQYARIRRVGEHLHVEKAKHASSYWQEWCEENVVYKGKPVTDRTIRNWLRATDPKHADKVKDTTLTEALCRAVRKVPRFVLSFGTADPDFVRDWYGWARVERLKPKELLLTPQLWGRNGVAIPDVGGGGRLLPPCQTNDLQPPKGN